MIALRLPAARRAGRRRRRHADEQPRLRAGARAAQGIALERARVGDRYVLEQLIEQGWQLGGENSGHLICLDKHTTGDAIVAALAVLRALIEQSTTLAEATAAVALFPQRLINVPVRARLGLAKASAAMQRRRARSGRGARRRRARAAAALRHRAGAARDGRGARARDGRRARRGARATAIAAGRATG